VDVVEVAIVALVIGLAFQALVWWGPRVADPLHTRIFVWFFLSLAAALVIFALFPASSADTSILGFKLGGALAGFVAVWWLFSHFFGHADRISSLSAELVETKAQLEHARAQLVAGQAGAEATEPNRVQTIERYTAGGKLTAQFGIITGDIGAVTQIDVWVNPENTNMQMSRFYEGTVSGRIRYLGAKRDFSGRKIEEDNIANELREAIGDALDVVPGTVVATGPGALLSSNNVKLVFHVAAVEGKLDRGYVQVSNVQDCVTNALKMMDARELSTILFPLMGAGRAGGNPLQTARILVGAALAYVESHADARKREIFFLAWSQRDLAALRAAFQELELRPCASA
jgi:O-acetyl-ADP-ribose deacetylase (regulator of RNase III)